MYPRRHAACHRRPLKYGARRFYDLSRHVAFGGSCLAIVWLISLDLGGAWRSNTASRKAPQHSEKQDTNQWPHGGTKER